MFFTAWPINSYGFEINKKLTKILACLALLKYRVLLIHEFFYKLFILFALTACCTFSVGTRPEENL